MKFLSPKTFVSLFAVILVVGTVLVVVGVRVAGAGAAADGQRMASSADANRALLQIRHAMGRYRIEAATDADGDAIGEYGDLPAVLAADLLVDGEDQQPWEFDGDGGLQRGRYRYLPAVADDAEERFAVVALPGDPGLPVLAIDQAGDVRIAPSDFRPDPAAPVNPSDWPRWR